MTRGEISITEALGETAEDRAAAQTLVARLTAAERDRSHPPVPVRDAASLIVFDPDGPAVLMGRRNAKHTFMPGHYVFPGGRVDRRDGQIAVASPYRPAVDKKLGLAVAARQGAARRKAFAVAALRETYEETGVLIGRPTAQGTSGRGTGLLQPFAARGLELDLSALTFVARAITPPGRPRRYDTRFFLAQRASIRAVDDTVVGPDAELEDIRWVPLSEARTMALPTITLTVLDELTARLGVDPHLGAETPVPFYRWVRKGFVRRLL